MIHLELPDLLYVAQRAIGGEVPVRDYGLLESALARPRSSAFGTEIYPSVHLKAAALAHSLVHNHALVDGNKRLTLGALVAFLGLNGLRLTWDNDDAYEFVMSLAEGDVDDVPTIAALLEGATQPR